jgi:hypothetical protein
MAFRKRHNLVSILMVVAVSIAPLLISTSADAASGLFRMKRTWWGGTSSASPADPYISTDYHPHLRGPDKAPAAIATVGSTTVSGRPAPRFTAPEKFIVDYTYYGACVPGTCAPGYPESKSWYSYWNVAGSFRPNNSQFGGAAGPTTVVFPTTGGNLTPPYNQGQPVYPTSTPCVGGGLTNGVGGWNCGEWAHSTLGDHYIGEPISFADGAYDFSRAGSIMITPGQNRFGGTMHFFYGANHTYYQLITIKTGYISKAYGPQMDVRDPAANTVIGDVQYGGPFNIYRMTVGGDKRSTTPNGGYYSRLNPYFYTLAPFTTGMVTGWQPFGATNTEFTLTGYDNRTPAGLSGVVSLVRPRMVHVYSIPEDPNDPIRMTWASASAWQMDFHFLPEPGSTMMLASGLVLMAGLYRLRRR